MITTSLTETAGAMVRPGHGILAIDESVATMSARLSKVRIEPTEENRRAYREMLVTTPGLNRGISGVIMCDETFRQSLKDGRSFPRALTDLGILPGIKVDTGAKPLAGAPGETVTEGLDGLRDRLAEYASLGARFAKWRAVISIGGGRPTYMALSANAHALARYASLCQKAGLVPIVEPEVLMDGNHSVHSCAAVTSATLMRVFDQLRDFDVDLGGTALKPNMVVSGLDSGEAVSSDEVADLTVHTLRAVVPEAVAGIAFLSGGQSASRATANLAAMQRHPTPWPLTFSFGRALIDGALNEWRGNPEWVSRGQAALAHRVSCNVAALTGSYTDAMESKQLI